MRSRSWFIAAATGVLVLASGTPGASQAREALDGTDPVLLVEGKDVLGKPEFKVVRGGFEYLFASAETKATFERDPEKYEIQLGGLCARMGRGASGNPSDYLVHEGRIYIFGSDDCHKRFAAAPARFVPPAPDPMPASPEASRAGRALLDRAALALGGAALDTLATYVETATQVQPRMDGEVSIALTTTWRFPGDLRVERTLPIQGQARTFASVVTPGGAWSVMQGRTAPLRGGARASLDAEQQRRIVPLLRARGEPGLEVAALGRGTVAGLDCDRVRVRDGIVDATIAVDPATGRVHAISFVDRNGEGQYGRYTVVQSDYRPVNGLTLPFRAEALFDDRPDAFESRRISAIAVNRPVDPALFEPAGAK